MPRTINPPELFNSTNYGFSQIVISKPGDMVFISGQVAWDEDMKIVGKNDLRIQCEQTNQNLETAMKLAGGELSDIMMLRIYKEDYTEGDGAIISELLKKYFGTKHPPASTWLNVKGLANKDFMIEIEAQAILSEK